MLKYLKNIILPKRSSVEAVLENVKVHSCSGSGSGSGSVSCSVRG